MYFWCFRDERQFYYSKREKARQDPQKCISIILDGMDQDKTDLPHLDMKNKSLANMWVLRTHVTGALVHGRRNYAFVDVNLFPHDSNLTINVLLHILLKEAKERPLPPTLYLQLDNCWRENKNRYVFGFLAMLVKLGIFKEVLSFTTIYTMACSLASCTACVHDCTGRGIGWPTLKVVLMLNYICCYRWCDSTT